MENSVLQKNKRRKKRALRVRKFLRGSSAKPRMSVFKSNSHIYVQLIDDEKGKTLLGLGTLSKDLKGTSFSKKSKEAAEHLGALVAKKAKEQNIETVIFDRGRYKYHGIIAKLADSAREAGLQF